MTQPSNLPAIPTRSLGKTGVAATIFGLGGEGILRTHGQQESARAVIHAALDEGARYFDTAPAYASSMDYYGASLGDRRREIFLASKTHERTKVGSLRLLDESLRRLKTDWIDLWQLHDLRTHADLEMIFGPKGAIHALDEARRAGKVRFLGLTGHHDPAILLAAMERFDFDTVLVPINPADVHRLSFIQTVVPEAVRREMGVIGMKVGAQGALLGPGRLSMPQAMSYALSIPGVTNVIIGCKTPGEVAENANTARTFTALDVESLRQLESSTRLHADRFAYYKRA